MKTGASTSYPVGKRSEKEGNEEQEAYGKLGVR